MDIMRKEFNEKKEQLLTNMLDTITAAYAATREAQKKDYLLIGMFTTTKPDCLLRHYQFYFIFRNTNLVC